VVRARPWLRVGYAGRHIRAALDLVEAAISAGPALTDFQLPDHLERTVASVCDVCGKGPGFGNNISHSHRRTRRRWNPNIQTVRALVSGTPKRLNVCTSCIKAGKVTR
jgi:large subunit ribosomal protein L28